MINELLKITSIKKNEPLSAHTSFKIGGPADYMAFPRNEEELKNLISFLNDRDIPWFVMGNGTNLLVGDSGYRGVVVQLFKNFEKIKIEKSTNGGVITADSGALLSKIAGIALENSLEGMEGLSGIPGTLGGACAMNAGAYGFEIKNVLKSVKVLDGSGEVFELTPDELEMGYRYSLIPVRDYIVLSADIELKKGNREEIQAKMEDFKKRRITKQPIEKPCAGSTFKRPEGYFAGTLIEEAGLKGLSIGGASVSVKHSGFIISDGTASAKDVKELIELVIEKVREYSGITLEPEVKFVGEF